MKIIKNIRNYISDILTYSSECIYYLRRQNFLKGLSFISKISNSLIAMMNDIDTDEEILKSQYSIIINKEFIMSIVSQITYAQQSEDYILIADLIELQILPEFYLYQAQIVNCCDFVNTDESFLNKNLSCIREKDADLYNKLVDLNNCVKKNSEILNNYVIEPTSSGNLTLNIRYKNESYYLHSNVNPITEGKCFFEQYYEEGFDSYVIIGLGLGYHIRAFWEADDGLNIMILESDLNVIYLACRYFDLSYIFESNNIELLYDQDLKRLKDYINENNRLIIHYPSLRKIDNDVLRLKLEQFFIRDSGIRNQKMNMLSNFRENIKNCTDYVDSLKGEFDNKNIIIVAGGPSLDKNVELLKNLPKDVLILAVGTVYRKLMNMGIRPDFVIFLDSSPSLVAQIESLENEDIPIICGSTACKKISRLYKGKKYLVCQENYERAETYADKNSYNLYKTGGSVSTIALDISLRLGCREVAYIGLDLAYTDGKSHTCDTRPYSDVDDAKVRVKSVDGKEILASRLFVIYREWIERRISSEKYGRVIDATEGGALIKGMRIERLKEVLERWRK